MQFIIDEGRGNGHDDSLAEAINESAAALTAMGATPSAVVLTAADYDALRNELPLAQMPSRAQIRAGTPALFDGMRVKIEPEQ